MDEFKINDTVIPAIDSKIGELRSRISDLRAEKARIEAAERARREEERRRREEEERQAQGGQSMALTHADTQEIEEIARGIDPTYCCVITFDIDFTA